MLFGSQPFTSALVMSNPSNFKYEIIWNKKRPSNPMLAKIQHLKVHENILVFGKGKINYFPQGLLKTDKPRGGQKPSKTELGFGKSAKEKYVQEFYNYPKSIQEFGTDNSKNVHPTQKPIELMEYLIKTFTNEHVKCEWCGGSGEIESLTIDCDVQTCTKCKGEGVINSVILDNTFGSGTTCIAAKQLNRSFIGMEMDEKYFEIAVKRINEAQPHVSLFSDCP